MDGERKRQRRECKQAVLFMPPQSRDRQSGSGRERERDEEREMQRVMVFQKLTVALVFENSRKTSNL